MLSFICKHCSQLLCLNGINICVGFPASEKARLSKAWVMSMLFAKNSSKEKFESDILNYVMLLLNLLVVVAVIGMPYNSV